MKIAVISDIHSNIDALESVLKDIESKHVDEIICTGDLVGYLPFPNEVIKCFKSNAIKSIKGNHDVKVLDYKPVDLSHKSKEELQAGASIVYTTNTITKESLNYLDQLPEKIVLEHEGIKVLFVHGSPRKINEYMYEEDDHLEEIAENLEEDVLVFGHTHVPYHKIVKGKHFINPGSVGKPKHGNQKSAYMIIGLNDGIVTSELVQVTYDLTRICKAIEDEVLISDKLIENLKNGN